LTAVATSDSYVFNVVNLATRATASRTTDEFEALPVTDPEDDETVTLGDALADLAVGVEADTVAAVRDSRERLCRSRDSAPHRPPAG
jgi:hypothetical protein